MFDEYDTYEEEFKELESSVEESAFFLTLKHSF